MVKFEIDKHHYLTVETEQGRIHLWTTKEDLEKLGLLLFDEYGKIDWI